MFTFNDMPSRILLLLLFIVISVLIGCTEFVNEGRFEKLVKNVHAEILAEDEFLLMSLTDQWFDHSPSAREDWHASANVYLQKVEAIDTSKLNDVQILEWMSIKEYLLTISKRDSIIFHHYLVSHLYGLHLSTPARFAGMELKSKRDINTYFSDLENIASRFGGLIDGLELRRRKGLILPTFIIKQVIQQCDSIVEKNLGSTSVCQNLTRRLNELAFLSLEEKEQATLRCNSLIRDVLIPSYKRLGAYLRQLERASVSVAGVWQLPNGDEFYQHMLLLHCGVEDDPGRIYQIGKNELVAIESESELLKSLASLDSFRVDFTNYDTESKTHHPAFEHGLALFESYSRLNDSESTTPLEKASHLESERLATAKMMVDIGIHHKQWLRDQAVKFLEQHSLLSEVEAEKEVDCIIVNPGLKSAEKIGFLKLKELSEKQDKATYLKKIKSIEPVPLNILEKWLNRNKPVTL